MPDELEATAAAEADLACGPAEGFAAEETRFLAVFDATISTIEDADIPYVLMGGVASATVGRPRVTRDIDMFVRPEDARHVLDVLARAGFDTEERFPHWLYKAWKDGILVDVIFRSSGDIYLDDEMLDRSTVAKYKGRGFRLIPPEDLLVIKAIVHDEHMPRHWHDALGIVAGDELDWDYLLRRARHGARRVLSLLLYAQSNDLLVPADVIRRLFATIDEVQLTGGPS
jgi:predicted nucleotidyltransferase